MSAGTGGAPCWRLEVGVEQFIIVLRLRIAVKDHNLWCKN